MVRRECLLTLQGFYVSMCCYYYLPVLLSQLIGLSHIQKQTSFIFIAKAIGRLREGCRLLHKRIPGRQI